ncbi:MAG TPA: hypothetical protein VF188_13855 [Longimicrobiales bacterium]
MKKGLDELVERLPTAWLENYVAAFEAGRVQPHPQARFVNARGECCLVAALAGATSAEALVRSEVWDRFLGSALEELSRRFESCRLTGRAFYEEAVLALAARRGAARAAARRLVAAM